MTQQNKIPPTHIKPKESKAVNGFADQLVMFLEIERSAAELLMKEKRMTPQLDFKLATECRLLTNIIKNMIGMPLQVYQEKAAQIRLDPTFANEVASLANVLAPPPPLIIPPGQCLEEINKLRHQGKGKWSWAMG